MRVAIVHDDLTQKGGAERVVEVMHAIWQDAPIYTSVFDPEGTFPAFAKMNVRTSFMRRIPFASDSRFNKFFLTLYPIAFESLDLRDFDVVISHGTRFAHGIITTPQTCHIHYCHTPARFAWRYHEYVKESNLNGVARMILPFIIHKIRIWDQSAAARVDFFLSNSHNIAHRVWKYYKRSSFVLYPPVETGRFFISDSGVDDYLLVVSRMLPYKRIDLAIEACNRLKLPLKVVGSGPDFARLKRMAGPTVEILGRVPDGQVEALFARCRAFLFPGEEDFGIAPLEAMAAGRPVIALRAGGAVETVVEGKTGLFFDEQTPESLCAAIQRLDQLVVDSAAIRAHALQFDVECFKSRIVELVEYCRAEHKNQSHGTILA